MAGHESQERVLAVDTQPRMLASLEALATSRSLPLDTAATLHDARAMLAHGRHGVLLLDPQFPEGDGLGLIRELHDGPQDVDVVVLTSDPSALAPVQALRHGASDFLRKPCSPDELLLTVQNALERRHLNRKNREISSRLRRSERLYQYIVDSSPDLIYILDDQGHFTFVNDTVRRLLGYQPEMLLGRHFSRIITRADRSLAQYCFNERRTADRATRGLELRLQPANGGDPVHVDLNAMGMYGDGDAEAPGRFLGTYGVARDVTERKHAEAIIRHQAHHDMLTGLPNRVLFQDRLRQTLAQARRSQTRAAVLFLDLDRFKMVNDSLGHSFGDRLLEQVAHRLRDCLREGDTLARMGGDEFTILLPKLEREDSAARVAQKCVTALEGAFTLDRQEIYLGVSIGVAIYPEHGETMESLVKHADAAMYHAKAQETAHYAFYDPGMGSRLDHYLSMETGLRRALGNNELTVVYQPQVDTTGNNITAVEALLRWHHPERGAIPPMDFIPVAEQTGLIVPISLWLLREACLECLRLGEAAAPRLAVNLSSLQVEQPDFVDGVLDVLNETRFPPERLELEITEHLLLRNTDMVVDKLRDLSGRGVRFAIDDFGTGYSSLSYLQRLPIHILKIDQSFVQGLRAGSGDEATLVETIVAMARGLGLNVVAEGVETAEQMHSLQSMHCTTMQGYLFSTPLPADELGGLLAKWDKRSLDVSC